MCGRCGHLYGRCRISTERRVSRTAPDHNPGKKNSHREMLGDAPWEDVSISTGDVREMRSSLREMQDLHRETRLPTGPRPESGEKKFSSGDAGRCTLGRCAGDAVISTGDAGSPQRDASPDRPPTRIRGKKILIGRCWEMHPGEM